MTYDVARGGLVGFGVDWGVTMDPKNTEIHGITRRVTVVSARAYFVV